MKLTTSFRRQLNTHQLNTAFCRVLPHATQKRDTESRYCVRTLELGCPSPLPSETRTKRLLQAFRMQKIFEVGLDCVVCGTLARER